MNDFLKFVKKYQNEDSIIGDFCGDIIRDGEFPINGSETEMKDYVEFQASRNGIEKEFSAFIAKFKAYKRDITLM
jgi:hypothetical protein